MARFSFATAGMFSLSIIVALYMASVNIWVNAVAIEQRAGRKQLYNFRFGYYNDSGEESGKIGFTFDGYLRPFGNIQGGGNFNYDVEDGYGGEIDLKTSEPNNVNASINGLGVSYALNENDVDIKTGISAFDQNINFNLDIAKDGTVNVSFDVQSDGTTLDCGPSDQADNTTSGILCTATPDANAS